MEILWIFKISLDKWLAKANYYNLLRVRPKSQRLPYTANFHRTGLYAAFA